MPWIIDKSHIDLTPEHNGQTIACSKNYCREDDAKLTQKFRLRDSDEILYYEGRLDPKTTADWFEPLNWATWYAGATIMEVLEEGKWNIL